MQPKKGGLESAMDKERERQYWQHRERVVNQRSCIDNSTPESCAYVRKPGTIQGNPARAAQINHDNQKLVERMVHIMNTKGGIDINEPWRDHNKAISSQRVRSKKEARIAAENAKMLERLEMAQPSYREEKFRADRRRNEEFAARVSRYPYHPLDRPMGDME